MEVLKIAGASLGIYHRNADADQQKRDLLINSAALAAMLLLALGDAGKPWTPERFDNFFTSAAILMFIDSVTVGLSGRGIGIEVGFPGLLRGALIGLCGNMLLGAPGFINKAQALAPLLVPIAFSINKQILS